MGVDNEAISLKIVRRIIKPYKYISTNTRIAAEQYLQMTNLSTTTNPQSPKLSDNEIDEIRKKIIEKLSSKDSEIIKELIHDKVRESIKKRKNFEMSGTIEELLYGDTYDSELIRKVREYIDKHIEDSSPSSSKKGIDQFFRDLFFSSKERQQLHDYIEHSIELFKEYRKQNIDSIVPKRIKEFFQQKEQSLTFIHLFPSRLKLKDYQQISMIENTSPNIKHLGFNPNSKLPKNISYENIFYFFEINPYVDKTFKKIKEKIQKKIRSIYKVDKFQDDVDKIQEERHYFIINSLKILFEALRNPSICYSGLDKATNKKTLMLQKNEESQVFFSDQTKDPLWPKKIKIHQKILKICKILEHESCQDESLENVILNVNRLDINIFMEINTPKTDEDINQQKEKIVTIINDFSKIINALDYKYHVKTKIYFKEILKKIARIIDFVFKTNLTTSLELKCNLIEIKELLTETSPKKLDFLKYKGLTMQKESSRSRNSPHNKPMIKRSVSSNPPNKL